MLVVHGIVEVRDLHEVVARGDEIVCDPLRDASCRYPREEDRDVPLSGPFARQAL